MQFVDCIVEASTSTGTGDMVLGGPLTGFQAFGDWLADGEAVYYLIEAVDGSGNRTGQWETGLGTYDSGTDAVQRTSPSDGSATTPVSFAAGAKRVSLSFNAQAISDLLLIPSAPYVGQARILTTSYAFGADTSAAYRDIHWNSGSSPYYSGTYPERLTLVSSGRIPALAVFSAQINLSNTVAGKWLEAKMDLYNASNTLVENIALLNTYVGNTQWRLPIVSRPVATGYGYYAVLSIKTESNMASLSVDASTSYFQVEVRRDELA